MPQRRLKVVLGSEEACRDVLFFALLPAKYLAQQVASGVNPLYFLSVLFRRAQVNQGPTLSSRAFNLMAQPRCQQIK